MVTTEIDERRKDYLRVKCLNHASKLKLPELEKKVDECIQYWEKYKNDSSYDIEELKFVAAEFARILLRRKRCQLRK